MTHKELTDSYLKDQLTTLEYFNKMNELSVEMLDNGANPEEIKKILHESLQRIASKKSN